MPSQRAGPCCMLLPRQLRRCREALSLGAQLIPMSRHFLRSPDPLSPAVGLGAEPGGSGQPLC